MLLTGPAFFDGKDPEGYALALKQQGYKAGNCPDDLSSADEQAIQALKDSFDRHDLLFAEVGAWCNPLSTDPAEARRNQAYMVDRLKLADKLGAKTCVNIIGSKNPRYWAGPCPDGYTAAFAAEAADVMRSIIDQAEPKHSCLSFEMMPYIFLDSAESYLDFLQAIDRPEQTGVHLDICNAINSPRRYFDNGAFIKHSVSLLRPYIVSVHLKDIRLREDCGTVQFEEVLPGTGQLDYAALLSSLSTLPWDTPAVLEHLDTRAEYRQAAAWVREQARELDLTI